MISALGLQTVFVGGGVRGGAVGVCIVFGNERERVWVRREGVVSGLFLGEERESEQREKARRERQ